MAFPIHHQCANSPFWATTSRRTFCQICLFRRGLDRPVFTSLDFATLIIYRAKSSALRPNPNLEGQVPVFISPMNRVAQLYPQALSSLFVALYDSQGEGRGIVSHLHEGPFPILYSLIILPFDTVYSELLTAALLYLTMLSVSKLHSVEWQHD
jgi:hypothetical protein